MSDKTKYKVTEKAMRPASDKRECFYCGQAIGEHHLKSCVLVQTKAKLKVTIEYEVNVPSDWNKGDVEFHRNDSSWCMNNMLPELEDLAERIGANGSCLCNEPIKFECLEISEATFLSEE